MRNNWIDLRRVIAGGLLLTVAIGLDISPSMAADQDSLAIPTAGNSSPKTQASEAESQLIARSRSVKKKVKKKAVKKKVRQKAVRKKVRQKVRSRSVSSVRANPSKAAVPLVASPPAAIIDPVMPPPPPPSGMAENPVFQPSPPSTLNAESSAPAVTPTSTTVAESAPQNISQFSQTTKLNGEIIFGLTAGLSGDFSKNPAVGHRTRLELETQLGEGTLTTRLQANGLGLSNVRGGINTPEGTLSFADDDTSSSVAVDLLKYDFPLGENTQVTILANAGDADDFTNSINPLFDGDGGSGAISRFGNRPAIYYLLSGTGAGIRHKFSSTLEGSLGYLSNNANSPADGNGIFNGSYGAIAQLTYTPNENTQVGLTYVNAYKISPGIGSINANPEEGSNNMVGLQTFFQVNPKLAVGGWVGFNKNSSAGVDKDIMTWAVTAAFPNLGGEGNLAGLVIGQEPRVTAATNPADRDTASSWHLEGFYQVKVNDNLAITPGLIYLTAPNHDQNNSGALLGVIRTTFTF